MGRVALVVDKTSLRFVAMTAGSGKAEGNWLGAFAAVDTMPLMFLVPTEGAGTSEGDRQMMPLTWPAVRTCRHGWQRRRLVRAGGAGGADGLAAGTTHLRHIGSGLGLRSWVR